MSKEINRREWLRRSALLTGGMTLLPGIWESLSAAPTMNTAITNAVTGIAVPPDTSMPLKARLFANENPFGPSDKVKQVIMDSLDTSYQYGFNYIPDLKKQIAAYEGISEDHILLGAGSSPLLMAASVHYSKNGGSIVTCDPTFDSLPRDAEALKAKWVKVPLTADYAFNLDGLQKAIDSNTSLVYIVNPNNPTGTVLDSDKLKAFCASVSKQVPVFVDEAYIDYLPNPKDATLISNIKQGDNLIVARTFSKIYGLAGMRIGYIVAQPDTIKTLAKYNVEIVPTPSIKAAMAAYQDQDFMKMALAKTTASRDYLFGELKRAGHTYIPSITNFAMFPIPMKGEQFVNEMMKRSVAVRYWKFAGKEWCRVSIGRMEEMEAFVNALKEVV